MQEIELIDRFVAQVAPDCALAVELTDFGAKLLASLPEPARPVAGRLVAERLADVLSRIDLRIRDLAAFLPIWEDGVARRRALVLQRQLGGRG